MIIFIILSIPLVIMALCNLYNDSDDVLSCGVMSLLLLFFIYSLVFGWSKTCDDAPRIQSLYACKLVEPLYRRQPQIKKTTIISYCGLFYIYFFLATFLATFLVALVAFTLVFAILYLIYLFKLKTHNTPQLPHAFVLIVHRLFYLTAQAIQRDYRTNNSECIGYDVLRSTIIHSE